MSRSVAGAPRRKRQQCTHRSITVLVHTVIVFLGGDLFSLVVWKRPVDECEAAVDACSSDSVQSMPQEFLDNVLKSQLRNLLMPLLERAMGTFVFLCWAWKATRKRCFLFGAVVDLRRRSISQDNY